MIATTLYQILPETRKKVLAFVDGRQEAAFFAWYLEDSYKNILSRNLLLKVIQELSPHTYQGASLRELATGVRDLFREKKTFPPSTGNLELRREAWLALYREFMTDEPRISLEGVGLTRWSIEWPGWFEIPKVFIAPPWSLSEQEIRDLVFLFFDSMRLDRSVELRTERGVSINWNDLGLQGSQMRFRIGDPKNQKGIRSWDGKTGKRAQFLAKLLMKRGFSEEAAISQAITALRSMWESLGKCDQNAPTSDDRLLLPVDDARRLNPEWWRLRHVADDETTFRCDTCSRIQTVTVQAMCPRHRCAGTLIRTRLRDLEPNHYRLLYEENLPGTLRVEEHTAQLDREKARQFQREFKKGDIHILSCSTTFELGVDLGDLDTVFLRNVPPEAFNYAQRVGRAGRRKGYPGLAITYCRRAPHDLYHFSQPQRMLSGSISPPTLLLQNEKIITRHITAVALSHFFRLFPERFETVERLFKDFEHPSGSADFETFLNEHCVELEKSLTEAGLADRNWISNITGPESRFSLVQAEAASDYEIVKHLEKEAGGKRDYDMAKWAKARAKTIAEEKVLSFLSRKAVIPKYGFPVDVVELDTQRTQYSQESTEVSLQRDLTIAVAEFAPTNKLVANKKTWTSYGIKKVAEREWQRLFYKRCVRHNVFLRWQEGEAEPATPCGDPLPLAKYIIPRFGFVTDRNNPKPPTSRPAKVFTTRPYFAASLGSNPGTIMIPQSLPLITMKKVSPGLMAVLCEGRRGEGFYICGSCGAGFRKREKTHKTPYGQDCRGTLEEVSLGHEFVTDVLQLQFHPKLAEAVEPIWFAHALAYALVEGAAEVLEVPSTDLSTAVAHAEQNAMYPIILYDNVPGGAGLVARLEETGMFRACLEAAHKRVDGSCNCSENTSCYGCLRSYRNQFAHQYLQRGPVLNYLKILISKWK